MFDSIFQESISATSMLLMLLAAVVSGFLSSLILSFIFRSTKRFYVTNAILIATIAAIVAFVNGDNVGLGAGVAIGGAFGLTRFRSAQGTADEMGAIVINAAAGIAFGMGYLTYGFIISLGLSLVMLLFTKLNLFERKNLELEKLVKITIPEDQNYIEVYADTFNHFTKDYSYVNVKTTDMGALYKVSVKVTMKSKNEEKELLDEIRQKNGNLEVAIMPYIESANQVL